ncbi:MAG: fibronectin type III domain-containing protein [Acetobacteraceae bacterium]|nr:fibronectin type III domain-containing protein [Acetobacteraceae bacterium]
MPALVPIAVGFAAAVASSLPAFGAIAGTIAGAIGLGSLGAAGVALVAGTIGTLVATATSMLMTTLTRKPKSAGPATVAAQAQDQKIMLRGSVEARRVVYGRARISGPLLFAGSTGADQRFLHLVIALAGHRLAGVDEIWLDDAPIATGSLDASGFVTEGRFAGKVRFGIHLGDQVQPDPFLLLEYPGWAASDLYLGIAYLHVRLEYDREVFTGGLPNISAVVRGKADIWDPRSGTTGYTENWALCVLDYLRAEFGLRCATDEIDTASFIAAANLSDEAVPTDGAGATTEPRYTLNHSFRLDEAPGDVIERMVAAGAGALPYVAGQYRLFGGAYNTPTASLTQSDFAGAVELVTRPPASETFNCVRGTCIDPGRAWQATEFPPLKDAAAIAADGEESWKEIELPAVLGLARAQRLALQLYYRTAKPLTFRAPLKYGAGLRLAVWQVVSVTLPVFGWSAKPFRLTKWRFDPATAAIVAEFQEELASAYAWTWDRAQAVPDSPRTSLVNALSRPPAPAGLGFQESLYATRDGAGVRTRIDLAWAPVPHAFVRNYEVQYRPAGATAWQIVPVPADTTSVGIEDLAAGSYEVRVRARTSHASSDWAELVASVGGLAAVPPLDITGFALQSIGGFAFLRWDRHPDLDVRVGGRIELRHTPATGGTWAQATGIGEAIPGDATTALLPLKPGAYLAKAVDAGGRYSAGAAVVETTQATALAFANIASVTEHPAFAGTKSGAVVVSSSLRLDSGALIDGAPSFDAIADIDGYGGVGASGTYSFAGGIDLATVQRVRLTPRLLALVVNTLDLIDSRSAPIDSWLSFDGVTGGEADAWVEVRETPDNPGGTPVWSAWRRLDQGEFQNRAFQFRVQLRSRDPAFNIHITELSVAADKV